MPILERMPIALECGFGPGRKVRADDPHLVGLIALVRTAVGTPFFLEEIVRTPIDAGAVVHESATGRWRATAEIETITIPDTIQGVIMARVDRLDEEVKPVLRTASVIGRSFSTGCCAPWRRRTGNWTRTWPICRRISLSAKSSGCRSCGAWLWPKRGDSITIWG